MELGSLVDRLDDRLGVSAYEGVDPSRNGLQVGDRSASIDRVVGAVDAAMQPIEAAADRDADLLVVHHGLFWGDEAALVGYRYDRIRTLVKADLALYAAHLPLDGHGSLGNAAVIADSLGMDDIESFPVGDTPVGCIGSLAVDADELLDRVADAVDRELDHLHTLGPTPGSVERVAIVTGSGTDYLEAVVDAGADVLITGEGKHSAFHAAEDIGLPVILAGHYATETGGVQKLLERIDRWGPETAFVDIPTGL